MRPPPVVRHGDPIDETGAELLLMGAILWAEREGGMRPTALGLADWLRLVADLDPREVFVVVLRVFHDWTNERIGDWLGGLSRGMADVIWQRATERLRAAELTI